MVKTKQKKLEKIDNKISLSLVCTDKTYKATSDDFNEILDTIRKESLTQIKTWGVFKLKIGKKKSEFRYSPVQIKRIFNGGGFNRKILLDRLTSLLR